MRARHRGLPVPRSLGAIGASGEKYGDIVSVYTITDADTAELAGRFQILREEAVSAGIRRIKAVLR